MGGSNVRGSPPQTKLNRLKLYFRAPLGRRPIFGTLRNFYCQQILYLEIIQSCWIRRMAVYGTSQLVRLMRRQTVAMLIVLCR
jgi:hypothetical protein